MVHRRAGRWGAALPAAVLQAPSSCDVQLGQRLAAIGILLTQ